MYYSFKRTHKSQGTKTGVLGIPEVKCNVIMSKGTIMLTPKPSLLHQKCVKTVTMTVNSAQALFCYLPSYQTCNNVSHATSLLLLEMTNPGNTKTTAEGWRRQIPGVPHGANVLTVVEMLMQSQAHFDHKSCVNKSSFILTFLCCENVFEMLSLFFFNH